VAFVADLIAWRLQGFSVGLATSGQKHPEAREKIPEKIPGILQFRSSTTKITGSVPRQQGWQAASEGCHLFLPATLVSAAASKRAINRKIPQEEAGPLGSRLWISSDFLTPIRLDSPLARVS